MHAKGDVCGQPDARHGPLLELLRVDDHHLGTAAAVLGLLVFRIVHQRHHPAVVLVQVLALARHEEGLHGELTVAGHPLDLLRVAERVGGGKGHLGQRLHGAVDPALVGAHRRGEVHVLVGLSGVVPAGDGELAGHVGQAVMRRSARLGVDEEAGELHAGVVVLAVGRADVGEVQGELIPRARVEHDLAVLVLETVDVVVRVAPVVRLDGHHLARFAAAREDAEERAAVRVFANELREARLLEDVLGEHRGEVNLNGAVEQDVIVIRHHQIVHVRGRVVVRAPFHLVTLLVELVEHRLGGLRAPVHLVEERDASAAAAVGLVHGPVVARVHRGGQGAAAVSDGLEGVGVELVGLLVVHRHEVAAPVEDVVSAVLLAVEVTSEDVVEETPEKGGLARVLGGEDAGLGVFAELLLLVEVLGADELVAEVRLAVLDGDGGDHAVAVEVGLLESVLALAADVHGGAVAQQGALDFLRDLTHDLGNPLGALVGKTGNGGVAGGVIRVGLLEVLRRGLDNLTGRDGRLGELVDGGALHRGLLGGLGRALHGTDGERAPAGDVLARARQRRALGGARQMTVGDGSHDLRSDCRSAFTRRRRATSPRQTPGRR